MSRTLDSSLVTELGLTVTRPGYLVEIEFSTSLRLSTLGTVDFAGFPWQAADVRVDGLSADGGMGAAGRLVFGNTWGDYGALALNEGVADRAVRIYACYAGAPAVSVQVFEGAGDEATFDEHGRLSISLVTARIATAHWPRRRINAAAGFNTLIPAGRSINIGGQPYILERR